VCAIAAERNVPVYVLADRLKHVDEARVDDDQCASSSSLWPDKPPHNRVQLFNPIFERVERAGHIEFLF
jgi:translation initiation factor 2B subunit (eIF-2B alpha/beta/delta family)